MFILVGVGVWCWQWSLFVVVVVPIQVVQLKKFIQQKQNFLKFKKNIPRPQWWPSVIVVVPIHVVYLKRIIQQSKKLKKLEIYIYLGLETWMRLEPPVQLSSPFVVLVWCWLVCQRNRSFPMPHTPCRHLLASFTVDALTPDWLCWLRRPSMSAYLKKVVSKMYI